MGAFKYPLFTLGLAGQRNGGAALAGAMTSHDWAPSSGDESLLHPAYEGRLQQSMHQMP